jgi:hypothetical protein
MTDDEPGKKGMRTTGRRFSLFAAVGGLVTVVCAVGTVAAACANANPVPPSVRDGGAGVSAFTTPITGDGGTVQAFAALGPADPGAGGIYVTISGESNALTGYPFPPGNFTTDTYMVDGWEFHIEEYLVNVDHIRLWSDPDINPTNQGQVGMPIAHLDGPFVVDLHKGGAIIGQGGAPEEATPIGAITTQNDNGGGALVASGSSPPTYAFGFSTVQASYSGFNVNLDPSEFADFDDMVEHGYSVMYVGTAQWLGNQSTYGCTQTTAGAGPDAGIETDAGPDAGDAGATAANADGGYDFSKLPQSFTFHLGFSTPTNYVNCQNMTMAGTPLAGEDYPRGIQVSPSQSVIAQVTIHMDHPFWESFAENSPVHWDQIAAQYVGASGTPEARIEDLVGVSFDGFTDKNGTPLPWRNCSGPNYTPPGDGQMNFSTLNVPQNPHGICTGVVGQDHTKDNCPAIRDYYDYIRYTQSTQGHLNSQGLCYIDRQYPAPAGGS